MTKSKNLSDSLKRAFGSAVKVRRKRIGISQDELAWRATLHRTYITNVERGICNPSLGTISKIASALNTNATALMADVEALTSSPRQDSPDANQVDILLVEDSESDAELTVAALKGAGLANTVHVARDGEAALDYFFGKAGEQAKPHPRLILLDLNLPKISGLDVLQRLKADKRTADIPVVVLTGSRADYDITECKRHGARSYIVKPVSFQNLSQVTPQLNLCWLLLQNPLRPTAVAA